MVILQGDLWWVDFGEPIGSGPDYHRPAVIVQSDSFNRSRLSTLLCVPLTTNVKWAAGPGNVLLKSSHAGLPQDSVATALLTSAIDRAQLIDPIGRVTDRDLQQIFRAIDIVLGRTSA